MSNQVLPNTEKLVVAQIAAALSLTDKIIFENSIGDKEEILKTFAEVFESVKKATVRTASAS